MPHWLKKPDWRQSRRLLVGSVLVFMALFLLGCGLFWEVLTPLYLSRSVGDPRDVLACWLGGMSLWLWDRHEKTPST